MPKDSKSLSLVLSAQTIMGSSNRFIDHDYTQCMAGGMGCHGQNMVNKSSIFSRRIWVIFIAQIWSIIFHFFKEFEWLFIYFFDAKVKMSLLNCFTMDMKNV